MNTPQRTQGKHVHDPDDFEPELLPKLLWMHPDQGPVPASIPIEPEHGRRVYLNA